MTDDTGRRQSADNEVAWNFAPKVTVSLWSHISHADAAPLLDELNSRFVSVTSHRNSFDAPAAGAQEIAVTILVTWAAEATWTLFFAELAEAGGQRIRAAIRQLLPRAERNDHGRDFIPVAIRCGKAQLSIDASMTEDDLVEAMASARDAEEPLVHSLSDNSPVRSDALDSYVWDKSAKLWVPGHTQLPNE